MKQLLTELEDARVHRAAHCCQFLPSCRFRIHIEVRHTHTHTKHMKVVYRNCNVPHSEIIRRNLRVPSGFGMSPLTTLCVCVFVCVCVCEWVSVNEWVNVCMEESQYWDKLIRLSETDTATAKEGFDACHWPHLKMPKTPHKGIEWRGFTSHRLFHYWRKA
jgi:hypothetical protein